MYPLGHFVHKAAAIPLNCPIEQFLQSSFEFEVYFPAEHEVHSVLSEFTCFPALQNEQLYVFSCGAILPGGHVEQFAAAVLE